MTLGGEVEELAFRAGAWRARTIHGEVEAPVVVDAAGAWADQLAALAGVPPIGLTPRRRTAILVECPDAPGIAASAMTIDIDERFYFKPDAGRLLLSPADETATDPCDAQADEMDIALAVDRVELATTLTVRRVLSKWAGLRSFVADRSPVVGFDPAAPGFFWLAGQGGYGIQTAPAMGRLAAALIRGETAPRDILDFGLTLADVAPGRLARSPPRQARGRAEPLRPLRHGARERRPPRLREGRTRGKRRAISILPVPLHGEGDREGVEGRKAAPALRGVLSPPPSPFSRPAPPAPPASRPARGPRTSTASSPASSKPSRFPASPSPS